MNPVSVLLPFHNAAFTLDAAITSITEQTLPDWELLLIDNASNDAGPSIARDWSQKDTRIKLIEEPTVGIAHALFSALP